MFDTYMAGNNLAILFLSCQDFVRVQAFLVSVLVTLISVAVDTVDVLVTFVFLLPR